MKEFKKSKTITYNLMSFTGFKSLLLFSLLLEGPKTYEEICQYFKEHEYVKEGMSIDTLRVYITSLKRVGCDILRRKTEDGGRYEIVSHPFEFVLEDGQIKSLVKVYRILAKTATVSDIYNFENFLIKLANKIDSKELLGAIEKVSVFKTINKDVLETLIEQAKHNNIITMLYDSPKSGLKEIQVTVNDLGISENKLYLYGISFEYNQESSYLIHRIQKITNISENNVTPVELNYITVGYELATLNPGLKLLDNERLVEIKEASVIVEATTTNLFMMKRRILEYGPLCTVLYPEDFKEEIVENLRNMRKRYRDA